MQKKKRMERKYDFSLLLETELISKDHRANSKQQLELHHNEKRNDGFPVESVTQYD